MSRLKHTHIMGLVEVCLDGGPAPYVVMPYMINGSLLEYLKRERDKLVFTDNEQHDEDEVHIKSFLRYIVSLISRFKKSESD